MIAPCTVRRDIRRRALAILAVAGFLLGSARWVAAAEEASPQLFDEQLAAGEFAPALAAAKGLDAAQRDGRLAQLAAAQAQAGERGAAFSTLASLSDDRRRTAAIDSTRAIVPSRGAAGGTQADFDSLIDLITNTVSKDSWEDPSGGPGTIEGYNNGVYVDAHGLLKRAVDTRSAKGLAVERLAAIRGGDNTDARLVSPMRKVSLTRLEKHVQLCLAAGRRPNDEMMNLAGLEKIQYVLVYPESQDIVLAGPAGPWRTDDEGRRVSRASGRPVLQLDDLVVLLRFLTASPGATFSCSINPTPEGLARTKKFAEQSSATPLRPGQRAAYLKALRGAMGRQTISIEGIDPRTRVARVMVEADYRMKLVGMGLEEGTLDVPSYLDLIHVARGQAPPPLDVLRWWFTLNYDVVRATPEHDAFEIRGPGVQVKSENEFLTDLGEQVHTGKSEPLNAEFAHRFTQHFAALAQKYPVYADLQNIFDLALVAALVQREHLAERVNWHMTCFGDPARYEVALSHAPQNVESVINHRLVGGKHLIVGVSGGVRAEPWKFVSAEAITSDSYGSLEAHRNNSAAQELPLDAWWWD